MTFHIKTNTWMRFFFIITITAIVFYLIFQTIDLNDVISTLINSNKFYILLSIIPLGISLLFNAARWQSVLRATGYEIALKECFIIFMAAIPFSSITPSKSGDVVRAYYLKNKIPIAHTVGSVVTERTFDLAVLACLSLVGTLIWGMHEFALVIFSFIILLGVFIFFMKNVSNLPIPETWNQKVQNFCFSMNGLLGCREKLIAVMLFSSCIWILAIVQTMLLFSALSISVPLVFLIGVLPIAILIGMIPVTLGGMGTRDAAFIVLFSAYATSEKLLAVGLLFTLFRYWLLGIAGLPFMKYALKNV
jgi:glycosyltransferase 2 family protein